MSSPALSSRPSTPGSSSSDDDEHTLYTYGEIFLSNIHFIIPSLPTTVTRRRDDSRMDEKEKTKAPLSARKRRTAKHALPSVIRKILPPSPSAAELSPKIEFERLVAICRETRVSDRTPPQPDLVLPTPPKATQPRQTLNGNAVDKNQGRAGTKDAPAKRMPLQRSTRVNDAKPKPKETPFRGGRLPVRPPLPRWDMLEITSR